MPKLVTQINFTEWTGGNSRRHSSYQGLREDMPAEQVIREKKKRLNRQAAGPMKFVSYATLASGVGVNPIESLVGVGHGTQPIDQN